MTQKQLKLNHKENKQLTLKIGKNSELIPHQRIYRSETGIWKNGQYNFPLVDCKLNPQWGTTTHPLDWPKPRAWQYQQLVRI